MAGVSPHVRPLFYVKFWDEKMLEVLFVCVHNAGRSQMASEIFNSIAERQGLNLHAESGGTKPADRIHPGVRIIMENNGHDITDLTPKMVDEDIVKSADMVITMGCGVDSAECPSIVYADVQDWGIVDPVDKNLDETQYIYDEIFKKVTKLINDLA